MSKLLNLGKALPDPHNRFSLPVGLVGCEDVTDPPSELPPPLPAVLSTRSHHGVHVRYMRRTRPSSAWLLT